MTGLFMRNLSSQSIFHYTHKFDNIKGIMGNGFKYNLLREALPLKGFSSSIFHGLGIVDYQFEWFAICFCDLPLSMVSEHKKRYGNYCIGLSKEWGTKNGVTPIRYVHEDSPDLNNDVFLMSFHADSMSQKFDSSRIKMLAQVFKDKNVLDKNFDLNELDNLSKNLKTLLKLVDLHIQGLQYYIVESAGYWRIYSEARQDEASGEKKERIFYDEREWRGLTNNPEQPLSFSVNDVTHIFLENRSEGDEIIQLFKQKDSSLAEGQIGSKIRLWNEFMNDL